MQSLELDCSWSWAHKTPAPSKTSVEPQGRISSSLDQRRTVNTPLKTNNSEVCVCCGLKWSKKHTNTSYRIRVWLLHMRRIKPGPLISLNANLIAMVVKFVYRSLMHLAPTHLTESQQNDTENISLRYRSHRKLLPVVSKRFDLIWGKHIFWFFCLSIVRRVLQCWPKAQPLNKKKADLGRRSNMNSDVLSWICLTLPALRHETSLHLKTFTISCLINICTVQIFILKLILSYASNTSVIVWNALTPHLPTHRLLWHHLSSTLLILLTSFSPLFVAVSAHHCLFCYPSTPPASPSLYPVSRL